MKKLLLAGLVGCTMFLTSCDRVQPSEFGVVMENYGKNGKGDFTMESGRVWLLSPGKELFKVPSFEQRESFETSLTLKSSDNTEFKASPVYSYKIKRESAIDVVFNNKQLTGTDFSKALADNVLEPRIYDLAKEESRKYKTDVLMAEGGSLMFEKKLEEIVAKELDKRGIELLSFSAQLEFSDKVRGKIDARNEVNTNVSVLDQQIIEQRKRNELEQLKTEQALIRSKGLTQEILQEQAIKKWSGHVPTTYSGDGGVPFMKQIK